MDPFSANYLLIQSHLSIRTSTLTLQYSTADVLQRALKLGKEKCSMLRRKKGVLHSGVYLVCLATAGKGG